MEDGVTPVHMSAAHGTLDILMLMFESQPDRKGQVINAQDDQKMTPLHKAAFFDRADIVSYLLDEVG